MAGRNHKLNSDVLAKLDAAFLMGHSDEEACIIAQIHPATLYRYCKRHEHYASKKELFKQNPKLIARRNIMKGLQDGNIELSKWYLERKAKDEFSPKQELVNQVEISRNETLEVLSTNVCKILERRD